MSTRKTLLFDVDDVLACITDAVVAELSDLLGRPWSVEEMPEGTWDFFTALPPELGSYIKGLSVQPGFATSLKPDPEAQLAIEYLRRSNSVFAVTAPHLESETWVYERYKWLEEHYDLDHQHVVHTHAKHVCEGDMFVDDNPNWVESWANNHPNGRPILWNTTVNARLSGPTDKWRVSSWDDLIEIVEKL